MRDHEGNAQLFTDYLLFTIYNRGSDDPQLDRRVYLSGPSDQF